MAKIHIPPEVMTYFQKTGSLGGKARAERHTKAELREWGKLGGRPRGKKKTTKGGK